MAPRPLSTTVRTSRPGRRTAAGPSKPSIYAVHSGPQRGVHMLSPDPPPLEVQYLYRHPINHHPTFLTFSGDFLRRRFDSIEAAVKWIDERDREDELVNSLSSTTIGNGKQPTGSSPEIKMETERLPRRDKERKAWKDPVYGMRGMTRSGEGGVGKRRWEEREEGKKRFSYSHIGVRIKKADILDELMAEEKEKKEVVAVKSGVSGMSEVKADVKGDEMELEEEL